MTLEQNIKTIADAVADIIVVESAHDAGAVIAELSESFMDMRKVLIEKEKLERAAEQIQQRESEISAKISDIRQIEKPKPRKRVEGE